MKTVLYLSCFALAAIASAQPESLWSRQIGSPGIDEQCTAMTLLPDGQIVVAGQVGMWYWGSAIYWLSPTGDILAQTESNNHNIQALAPFRGGLAVARLGIVEYMHELITVGCVEMVDSNRIGMYPICDTSPEFAWLPFCAFNAVTTMNSETVLLCGEAVSFASNIGFWLHWTDAEGHELNSRYYAVNGTAAAVRTTAAGVVAVGTVGHDSLRAWGILRTDSNGDSLWFRRYATSRLSEARAVLSVADGGMLVAGAISDEMDSLHAALLRVNENGDSLWMRTYGGVGSAFHALTLSADDNIVAAGYTSAYGHGGKDFLLFKIDANGDSIWSTTFGGAGDEICNALDITLDSGYVLAGTTYDSLGVDWWVVRTSMDLAAELPQPLPFTFTLHQNYPNPFNAATDIRFELAKASDVTLRIFDLNGREVATLINSNMRSGEHTVTWKAENTPSGLYFYQLAANGFSETKKLVLLK